MTSFTTTCLSVTERGAQAQRAPQVKSRTYITASASQGAASFDAFTPVEPYGEQGHHPGADA